MSYFTPIADERTSKAEDIIGFGFTHRVQLRTALRLADAVYPDGNKYLALLGDTVIKLVLMKEGIRRGATRGQINNIVSERGSNTYLAQRGFSTGLDDCIYKNPSQENKIYTNPMASTVEAIIGAVFNESAEILTAVGGVMKQLGIWWPE